MTHTDQAISCVLLDRAEGVLNEVLPMTPGMLAVALADVLRDIREARQHITDKSDDMEAWSA